MKRFLIRFCSWLPLFFAGIAVVGFGAQLHPRFEFLLFGKATQFGHTIFRIPEFVELEHTPTLLTLGSSTCYRGIDPRPFANRTIDAFNLCSSSQSFFNSEFLLDWSLDHSKKPKTLLMDVYPQSWNLSGMESARDLTINNDLAFEGAFQRMAWNTLDIQTVLKASYFGIKRLARPHGILPRTGDVYISGGFSFSNNAIMDSEPPCETDTVSLSRKQGRAFERIRQTCEEEGIQLLLVNPPQLCEEVFEKPEVMEGLPWIEGNDWPLAKVDTLYYDDHHLRGVGAELYSEWLAGQVAALLN